MAQPAYHWERSQFGVSGADERLAVGAFRGSSSFGMGPIAASVLDRANESYVERGGLSEKDCEQIHEEELTP